MENKKNEEGNKRKHKSPQKYEKIPVNFFEILNKGSSPTPRPRQTMIFWLFPDPDIPFPDIPGPRNVRRIDVGDKPYFELILALLEEFI